MDCSIPCNPPNYLSVDGGCISMISLTFVGSNSIPLLDTINPKSLPVVTPNTHFFGFSLTLYYSNQSNIFARTSR